MTALNEKETWVSVLGEMEVVLSPANFKTWFKDTFIVSLTPEEAVIGVPNIFAVDYSKGHPARAGNERFKQIKCLSRELLHAQIDILKPDIILFVSGGQGVHARREYFPDLTPSGMDTDGIEKRFLERFYFPAPLAHIECYRSSHPSARAKKNQEALKKLVSLLPCKEKKPA